MKKTMTSQSSKSNNLAIRKQSVDPVVGNPYNNQQKGSTSSQKGGSNTFKDVVSHSLGNSRPSAPSTGFTQVSNSRGQMRSRNALMQHAANTTNMNQMMVTDKQNINVAKTMGPQASLDMRPASAKRNSHQVHGTINKLSTMVPD